MRKYILYWFARLLFLISLIYFLFFVNKGITQDYKQWQKAEIQINEMTVGVVIVNSPIDTLATSFGSGVVIGDSVVITSNHVVAGAPFIKVYHDGRSYNAEVVKMTGYLDGYAILKVDHRFTTVAEFDKTNLFEEVMVKGMTSTIGYFTEIQRIVKVHNYNACRYGSYFFNDDVIRGMSGCGVWNIKGKLVGMVYAYLPVTQLSEIGDYKFPYEKRFGQFVSSETFINW